MGSFFDDMKLGLLYAKYQQLKGCEYFALSLTIASDVRDLEPDQIRSLLQMLEGADDQDHAEVVRKAIIQQARIAGRL